MITCSVSSPAQDPSAYPQPTSQDLASFWDLLQLNIEDVRARFQDLQKLKDSGWRLPPEKKVRDQRVRPTLVSLQHSPRAKMALCRRVEQMAVASRHLQAASTQNRPRGAEQICPRGSGSSNWWNLISHLNFIYVYFSFPYFSCTLSRKRQLLALFFYLTSPKLTIVTLSSFFHFSLLPFPFIKLNTDACCSHNAFNFSLCCGFCLLLHGVSFTNPFFSTT